MSDQSAAKEIAVAVLNSDKTSYLATTGVLVGNVAITLADVQNVATVTGSVIGVFVMIALLIKHVIETMRAWKDLHK